LAWALTKRGMLTCAVAYRVREPTLPHHDSGNPEQHFLPEESQETAYELFHFIPLGRRATMKSHNLDGDLLIRLMFRAFKLEN